MELIQRKQTFKYYKPVLFTGVCDLQCIDKTLEW